MLKQTPSVRLVRFIRNELEHETRWTIGDNGFRLLFWANPKRAREELDATIAKATASGFTLADVGRAVTRAVEAGFLPDGPDTDALLQAAGIDSAPGADTVSASEAEVLRAVLAKHPKRCDLYGLATAIRKDRTTAGGIARGLIARGLLARPKRKAGVGLTPDGLELARRLSKG